MTLFEPIKSKSSYVYVFGFLGTIVFFIFLVFLTKQIFKTEKEKLIEGEGTKEKIITARNIIIVLIAFILCLLLTSFLAIHFNNALDNMKNNEIILENQSYEDIDNLNVLSKASKVYYCLSFIFIGVIIVCSLVYYFIQRKTSMNLYDYVNNINT